MSSELIVVKGDMGIASEIGMADIAIPRLHVAQALSKAVDAGKVRAGDIYDSVTFAVIPQPIEMQFISLKIFYEQKKKQRGSGTAERLCKVPFVEKEHRNLPYKEVAPDGAEILNIVVYEYHVLLPHEGPSALPFLFSMQAGSAAVARGLNTIFLRMAQAGIACWQKVFSVTTEKVESRDGFKYPVPKAELKRDATAEEVQNATNWLGLIKLGAVTVVEDEDDAPVSANPQPATAKTSADIAREVFSDSKPAQQSMGQPVPPRYDDDYYK